ncbi:MAG: iron-sulfur cluster repair di-iron protein [Bacteroidales bacterium]|nr:iron-sulfur cluster repair di-iron protein [Bacteroidales bacterium]
MSNHIISGLTIGQIIANDFRTASIFKKAGIDYYCGGNKSISEACSEKGVDEYKLRKQLEVLADSPVNNALNFKEWLPGLLCDYLTKTHHKFVLKSLPELVLYTGKIAEVHGEHHPELIEVASLFAGINEELFQHLAYEEEVLFPAIKAVERNASLKGRSTLVSQISRLQSEHEFVVRAMDKIKVLTQNYLIPEDSCNTYLVSLTLLEQFEDDLHIHIHLENNILYPKVLSTAE